MGGLGVFPEANKIYEFEKKYCFKNEVKYRQHIKLNDHAVFFSYAYFYLKMIYLTTKSQLNHIPMMDCFMMLITQLIEIQQRA